MENANTTNAFSLGKSLALLLTAALVIVLGKLVLKIDTTVTLLISAAITSIEAVLFGCKWENILKEASAGFSRMAVPIMILLLVGMMVGSWMISGTVPAMMYFGMRVLNADFFLPITFLFSFLMAMFTGTSWGTISTIGVALVGISYGLGMPFGYTIGAIVSGAYLGDSISPLSDAPLIASASCDVPLLKHIKASLPICIPAAVIALILYIFLGLGASGTVSGESYETILRVLPETFSLSIVTIFPVIVILVMLLTKRSTLPTLAAGTLAGILVALIVQGEGLVDVLKSLSGGYTGDSGADIVNGLINRGGINSMISTVGIVIGAAAFGAPLKGSGATETLVHSIRKFAKTPKQLMLLTWILHPIFLLISAGYYMSYPVVGGILSPVYDEYGIDRSKLSRILGATGIALASLIPWVPAGAFVIAQLDTQIGDFIGFAFFNLLVPIICLVIILTGLDKKFMRKKKTKSMEA